MSLIASTFLPKIFWLIVIGYLALYGVVTIAAFWAAKRFAGGVGGAFAGLLLGGVVALRWHVAYVPAGVAAGTLLGTILSILFVKVMNR